MGTKPKPRPAPAKAAKPPAPRIPPVTPTPTYGAGGKPYKAHKEGKSFMEKLAWNTSEATRIGRALRFRKGDYTKGK